MLKEKFLKLLDEVERINHPVVKYLNLEIDENGKERFYSNFSIFNKLDSELFDIYYIHNGTNIGLTANVSQLHLISNFFLNSIEYVYEILLSGVYDLLNRGLFPLFSSGFGEYLTLDIFEMKGGLEDSKVYLMQNYDPTLAEKISIYDNLYSLFETGIQCYKTGIMSNVNNEININIDREYKLARKLNPNSEFWKHE